MNRRGFTLPVALFTMALLGALASAVLLLALLRWRSGQRSLYALEARTLAESELDRVTAEWDPLRADSLSVGSVIAVPSGVAGRGLTAFDSLMRLGEGLFLVRSVAVRSVAGGPLLARDGVAELVRLIAPRLPDSMAVAALGPVEIAGAGQVDGGDHIPAGWTGVCGAPAAPGAGVMAGAGVALRALCGGGSCLRGSPPAGVDSALTPATIGRLGAMTLAELLAAADHRVSGALGGVRPTVTAGACVQSDSLNWGDPASPSSRCGRFFPVIEARPGTRLVSGQGQGVLLATGALELAGDAAFTGVVVALGPVVIRDRARVTGVVVAGDSLVVAGAAVIERSRCAVARALRGAARPGRRVERGWFRWE